MECNFKETAGKDYCILKYYQALEKTYLCDGPDCILQRILAGRTYQVKLGNCNCEQLAALTSSWYCPKHGNRIRGYNDVVGEGK